MKITFSMFREAPLPDGKPGPVSMRRILAVLFAAASLACYFMAFKYSAVGWWVFIPGVSFEAGSLLLMFFTTWADVAEVVGKIKGA